jgi:hypothetical protein
MEGEMKDFNVTMNVVIPSKLKQKLSRYAANKKKSRSEVVCSLLTALLEKGGDDGNKNSQDC